MKYSVYSFCMFFVWGDINHFDTDLDTLTLDILRAGAWGFTKTLCFKDKVKIKAKENINMTVLELLNFDKGNLNKLLMLDYVKYILYYFSYPSKQSLKELSRNHHTICYGADYLHSFLSDYTEP